MSGVHLNNASRQNKMSTSVKCYETPDTILINYITMEKLEITINKESNITAEELAKFIENFNLLKNEKAKKEIIELVKSMTKAENK
jgi:hypothetical protein